MKIIGISNFDDETVNDILIAESVNNFYAPLIVDFLNTKHGGDYATYHFCVKPDDYVLHKWEP